MVLALRNPINGIESNTSTISASIGTDISANPINGIESSALSASSTVLSITLLNPINGIESTNSCQLMLDISSLMNPINGIERRPASPRSLR